MIISLVGAVGADDVRHWWWHIGTLASWSTTIVLVRIIPAPYYKMLTRCILTITVTFIFLTASVFLSEKMAPAAHWLTGVLGNLNTVAAAITLHAVVAALLLERHRWVILTLSYLTVFSSGSRTAIIALSLGILLVAVLILTERFKLAKRIYWALLSLIGAVILLSVFVLGPYATALLELDRKTSPANLLVSSSNVKHSAWSWRYNSASRVQWYSPPQDGDPAKAQAIEVSADPSSQYPTIALIQSVGTSDPSTTYSASAWLRSDEPTSVILSSNLASIHCDLDSTWKQCSVPAVEGNGVTRLQFQIRYPAGVAHMKFQLWAPQLGDSRYIGPVTHTYALPDLLATLLRVASTLDWETWAGDENVQSRLEAYNYAIRHIPERLLTGWGLDSFVERIPPRGSEQQSAAPALHAHNLILQLLFERGIIGVFVLAMQFVLTFHSLKRPLWSFRAAILLSVIAALNITDVSFYSAGIYYLSWFAFAILLREAPASFSTRTNAS